MRNIRQEIAKRLKFEFDRRGLTPEKASEFVNIPADIISNYLFGKRKIIFDEIIKLCQPFGINSVRLLFNNEYPKTTLAFRNLGNNIQSFSSEVEDIFLIIENSLPPIEIPQYQRSLKSEYKRHDVIQEAGAFASRFRIQYPTPESFLSKYHVPIIPVKYINAEFDAFTISSGSKIAICINTHNRPPHRLIFSLAHEICHILFDRDREIQVDVFLPNLDWQSDVPNGLLPEFFAYKFAQFYLIPYEVAIQLSKGYPNLDLTACQEAVNKGRTLKAVLANAIFDTLSSNQEYFNETPKPVDDDFEYYSVGEQFRRMDYEENRQPDLIDQIDREIRKSSTISFPKIRTILSNISPSKEAASVHHFLEEGKHSLIQLISDNKESYSDDILDYIKGTLQIEFR